MSDPQLPDNVTPLHPEGPPAAPKPRLKKLRMLLILLPLGILALISTVFGMMMAVASDLPALENEPQYQRTPKNSEIVDAHGQRIGLLAANKNKIYVQYDQISANMLSAIIAVEDQRFESNNGVDIRGIARAFVEDVVKGGQRQGASTITQQFVKNALQAQDKRTVFEKLREAALAYHLTRKWGKKKILQEYLNSIYFGNGAYGIEAAAQTYFKRDVNHRDCGTQKKPCSAELSPSEAALLAGIVQNPTAYDPVAHPEAAKRRRNVVLRKMYEQKYIPLALYDQERQQAVPGQEQVRPPALDVKAPYFVTWIRQQLVDRLGAQRAFEGGLKIRTTIDLKLQNAAQQAVDGLLPPGSSGPTASLVAIDNQTGEVRAMVSGTKSYEDAPFNLATQGQRQPGSSFKPFVLAQALKEGYGPSSVWTSKKKTFCVVHRGKKCQESFVVNNDEANYVGSRTLANALTFSDNTVFAQVGIKVGTSKVAGLAQRMGIRTPVSSNLAMSIGGLHQGVTALDMAHAYETFETGGLRVSGSWGTSDNGPVGVSEITDAKGDVIKGGKNKTRRKRILAPAVAKSATQMMSQVVSEGTGKRAQLGEFVAGKTGTTDNYGDAWFVGFTDRMTVAVWVGYPNKLIPMKTDFAGEPVEGGTYPAEIWHNFMVQANTILDSYRPKDAKKDSADTSTTDSITPEAEQQQQSSESGGTVPDEGSAPAQTTTPAQPSATGGDNSATGGTGGGGGGGGGTQTPTPAPTPATPATPSAGGGDAGTGGASPGAAAAP